MAVLGNYVITMTNGGAPTSTPMSVIAVSEANAIQVSNLQPFASSGAPACARRPAVRAPTSPRGAGCHALFRALVSLTQYIRRSARPRVLWRLSGEARISG